jgi:hypothetical protein
MRAPMSTPPSRQSPIGESNDSLGLSREERDLVVAGQRAMDEMKKDFTHWVDGIAAAEGVSAGGPAASGAAAAVEISSAGGSGAGAA